ATLAQNHLEVTRELLPISARLIANKAAMRFKDEKIREIAARLAQELDRRTREEPA
ncbi:MAG: ATP phosphoribosyltransferase, partial [Clostridia bacterium]